MPGRVGVPMSLVPAGRPEGESGSDTYIYSVVAGPSCRIDSPEDDRRGNLSHQRRLPAISAENGERFDARMLRPSGVEALGKTDGAWLVMNRVSLGAEDQARNAAESASFVPSSVAPWI